MTYVSSSGVYNIGVAAVAFCLFVTFTTQLVHLLSQVSVSFKLLGTLKAYFRQIEVVTTSIGCIGGGEEEDEQEAAEGLVGHSGGHLRNNRCDMSTGVT